MDQTENIKLMESQVTEINKKIIYLSAGGHITPTICILAEHTKKMIRLHKLKQIANCMRLANKLLLEANESERREIRSAFFHLFLFLQTLFAKSEWIVIKRYIPPPLFNACFLSVDNSDHLRSKPA